MLHGQRCTVRRELREIALRTNLLETVRTAGMLSRMVRAHEYLSGAEDRSRTCPEGSRGILYTQETCPRADDRSGHIQTLITRLLV